MSSQSQEKVLLFKSESQNVFFKPLNVFKAF